MPLKAISLNFSCFREQLVCFFSSSSKIVNCHAVVFVTHCYGKIYIIFVISLKTPRQLSNFEVQWQSCAISNVPNQQSTFIRYVMSRDRKRKTENILQNGTNSIRIEIKHQHQQQQQQQ